MYASVTLHPDAQVAVVSIIGDDGDLTIDHFNDPKDTLTFLARFGVKPEECFVVECSGCPHE